MSDNSSKMSLEEKLVQIIKTNHLSSLIDDEDAMTDLVRRAVSEALFKEVVVRDEYNRKTTSESLVVQAARTHAEALVKKVTIELFDNDESHKLIRNLVIDMLPRAIEVYFSNSMSSLMQSFVANSISQLQSLKNNGQF